MSTTLHALESSVFMVLIAKFVFAPPNLQETKEKKKQKADKES